MRLYLAGFIIYPVILVPAGFVYLLTSGKSFKREKHKQAKEFGRFGAIAVEPICKIRNCLSAVKINLRLISEQLDENDSR